jgi:hypothetical protein
MKKSPLGENWRKFGQAVKQNTKRHPCITKVAFAL